jgi:glutathione synthetase
VRHTFSELQSLASLEQDSQILRLPSPLHPSLPANEIAVIYYRAAYTPNDYPDDSAWTTRLLLERSKAIKCPSMALQLAGAKKVQQVLCEDGVLEDFLLGDSRPDVGFGKGRGTITDAQLAQLRETWTGLWPLDNSPLGEEGYKLAKTEPERFVLKPQREGGGNNIYRGDIPPYLAKLEATPVAPGEPNQREGYVLMELIEPPNGLHNWLVRGGEGKRRKADVVSELGVYGVSIFGGKTDLVVNREGGTLLRTKGRESDEGGVAIGSWLFPFVASIADSS